MSERFILSARARLEHALYLAKISANAQPQLSAIVLELAPIVESAINAVDAEGCLPASVCTAVVRYGKAKP